MEVEGDAEGNSVDLAFACVGLEAGFGAFLLLLLLVFAVFLGFLDAVLVALVRIEEEEREDEVDFALALVRFDEEEDMPKRARSRLVELRSGIRSGC